MPNKYPFCGPLPQYRAEYLAKKHGISRREAREIINVAAGSRTRASYLASTMALMPSPPNGYSDERIDAFRIYLRASLI